MMSDKGMITSVLLAFAGLLFPTTVQAQNTPLRSFTWGANTQGLCFLGADGHVHAMTMIRPGTTDWVPFDITTAAQASTTPLFPNPQDAQTLAGYSFIVLDQHGQPIEDSVHAVYLGMDGYVHEAYAQGLESLSWSDHALTAAAAPLGSLGALTGLPTTPFGGYAFVAYNEDGTTRESTEHVIYLDRNGALHNLEYSPGGKWTDETIEPNINVKPLLTGSLATPIAAYSFVEYYPGILQEATEHVIFIDSNHRLHELWRPAGSAFWADNLLPGNPLVLDGVVTPLTAYSVKVIDSDQNLREISEHVIYVGADNALHELYNVRKPFQTGWRDGVLPTEVPPLVSAVQMTPLAGFGFFSAIIEYTSGGEEQAFRYDIQEISEHVIYIGTDGRLRELYNVLSGTPGWVDHALPTAAPPLFIRPTFTGPPAKTTPVAGHPFVVNYDDGTLAESTMHVFYIDQNSNLHEMYYAVPGDGHWWDRNLTQQLGVKPATLVGNSGMLRIGIPARTQLETSGRRLFDPAKP